MAEAPGQIDLDRAVATIREAGGRATPAKRAVLEVLSVHTEHLTADAITSLVQATSPDIAASTIYRILEEFERIGLVEHSHVGKGAATYHLEAAAHGHLVCQQCGSMIEADPAIFEQLIEDAVGRYGFQVDPHHFAVLGVCQDCLQA